MSEKKRISHLSSSGQSTIRCRSFCKEISSHCPNSAKTTSQITDAEIQKQTGHTKVIEEDKHIRIKIDLNRLTAEFVSGTLKNTKPATCDLIGAKKSDTMYDAVQSRGQRYLCNQKTMSSNDVAKRNKDMPKIQEFTNGNVSTTSQSVFNISSELLSDQLYKLLDDSGLSDTSVNNEVISATFSFDNNDAQINDAQKEVSEQYRKNICFPFHYNKTSKRNKRNLCLSKPFIECNISDLVEPVVAKGIVDQTSQSLVISMDPSKNMKPHRRNRLTYKAQYRMALYSKIYPDKSDKTIEIVNQLKRKSTVPISPVTYEYDRFLSSSKIMRKRIRLSLTKGPLDFRIPINFIIDYAAKCIVERITIEKLSLLTHKSWIDNSKEKLRYDVAIDCETIVEKKIRRKRKRCSTVDIPYENKRKCIAQVEYHNNVNKNEELIDSMRTQKELLKTNDDDRIITSRNKPICTIQKYQENVSLSKRMNGDLTENAKFSREILTLTKNIPWDFALRTCQIVMPVTVELDNVGMGKSSETVTNETTISEVVDEEKDNVLQTQNAFETSTNDQSDCTMLTVSETIVMENDVCEIVKEECKIEYNEDFLDMPDIEMDEYNEETDDSVESCSDDGLFPPAREGSIWQLTMADRGAIIFENVRPGDTDVESGNEESESEHKQVENQFKYEANQDVESPILYTIKSSDSDAEGEKYEEEQIAEPDVELNVIDEEKITIYELKTELCIEENSLEIDVLTEDKKPIFATPFPEDDSTVELDIESLLHIKKPGEHNSVAEVDKVQTVDIGVQSDLSKEEEISMEMHAESHSYNKEQSIKLICKMNDRNQNELNFPTYLENQNVIKNIIPEVRRTSATSFEIRFNDFQQITPPNHQPEVVLENVVKETNTINDVPSYEQKKEGKILIWEDKVVKLNVSDVSSEKQSNVDCQDMTMVPQNATEQTEGQSVTENDHQPLTTVPQQQVTIETQVPLVKQVQQPDTREFPQPVIEVIEERQEQVTTEPQLPVTIPSSEIIQTLVNNTYPVPVITTNVIIQNVTDNQMPRVPIQIPVTISYMAGYAQNYNELQIPSISIVQPTQSSETGELNPNLPKPYTTQNVEHQQNGPIAEGNHGETIKVISSNDEDIRVRQCNEKQASHIPSQENNIVNHNLYQNPAVQHINQTSMSLNNCARPIEPARSVVSVNQHTENTAAQMPNHGHNMIPQYSNQQFGIPENRPMPNNQIVQRDQYQPREYSSYKEMNMPRMDSPRTSMVAQQNNQTRIVTNHQPIPEPTRNQLIHSTQSDPMVPVANNGGTIGANGINMMQNPPMQHVNNPYAMVPYRNGNNLPSQNSPVRHNGAAINNNNLHSYQPSVQNHPPHIPPPYQGHMQYNTQTLPNNNMEHASQSLEILHQHYVNTNMFYRRVMLEQQSQLRSMNMKIEELHAVLLKQTPTTPRRGRKKKDDNDQAISPVVPNNSQQTFVENAGQQAMPIRMPSIDQDMTYLNQIARNISQQASSVPYIPFEEQRLAYQNHLARNNSQQVGSVPHVPSQENYLKYYAPGMDLQQEFPVSRLPPKEYYMKYRNRPVWTDFQEVSSTPLATPEESSTKYPNRSPGIDSQQIRPLTRTHFEEQNLKHANRPPGMDSQHVRPVPLSDSEAQFLQYVNRPPVQQGTQERYPLTSGLPEGSEQNVVPVPSKNVNYPKPEVPRSQNVNRPPVQQGTQERYPLTSGQPEGSEQNVIPVPSKNVNYPEPEVLRSQNVNRPPVQQGTQERYPLTSGHSTRSVQNVIPATPKNVSYPKPEVYRSQNVSMVQPSVPLGTVQQGTQERYPLTSGQSARSVQNVIPAPPKNVYYPKPEVYRSQNVPKIQPSIPYNTPTRSRHQLQESQPVNINNRPVRNEDATSHQNAQDLSNSSVNKLSNEDGPINLSIHDKRDNEDKEDNNVSPVATGRKTENRTMQSEHMELEALRKYVQKKWRAVARNESRDSGYIGSSEEGGS
ncbi:hypothetical protein CBL_14533 [Carabus blaptoides fortunei]